MAKKSPTFRAKNFFEEKFSPFQLTGQWIMATNGEQWQHFYTHLNALKTAQIESREDSKALTVAEIGKNGFFFVKRTRRFRNAGGLKAINSKILPSFGALNMLALAWKRGFGDVITNIRDTSLSIFVNKERSASDTKNHRGCSSIDIYITNCILLALLGVLTPSMVV